MSKKIRVAIAGVGNCASSLVQGVDFYKDHDENIIPGIMFKRIGGYHPADIEFVAAFDPDRRKVNRPLSEAIFAHPNCARIFNKDVPDGPLVQMVAPLDGFSDYMLEQPEQYGFRLSNEDPVNMAEVLGERRVDILLNYLPVGSEQATEFLADSCLVSGTSLINCIPVLSINSPKWEERFIRCGIPYIGSDMKSQFGASILSQMVQELAFGRGMTVDYHQQLNVGGNTDFNNMMVQSRLSNKKVSKENVIRAQNDLRGIPVDPEALFAGPSTFIPYLKDNKIAYFNIHMRGFGGAEVSLDMKLSVQDSENSGGVVIDAIRFLKVAREMGIMGCLRGPSAFLMKTPPKQMTYDDSYQECVKLANRELTDITSRQVDRAMATDFMYEEFESGSMNYLNLIKDTKYA